MQWNCKSIAVDWISKEALTFSADVIFEYFTGHRADNFSALAPSGANFSPPTIASGNLENLLLEIHVENEKIRMALFCVTLDDISDEAKNIVPMSSFETALNHLIREISNSHLPPAIAIAVLASFQSPAIGTIDSIVTLASVVGLSAPKEITGMDIKLSKAKYSTQILPVVYHRILRWINLIAIDPSKNTRSYLNVFNVEVNTLNTRSPSSNWEASLFISEMKDELGRIAEVGTASALDQ